MRHLLIVVPITFGLACTAEHPGPVAEVLTLVLEELPSRHPGIDPLLVVPRQLRMLGADRPFPGWKTDDYFEEPWSELETVARAIGLELCNLGEREACLFEAGPRTGFVGIAGPTTIGPDSAEVWVAATEMSTRGYSAEFAKVGLRRTSGGWLVTAWRVIGSAN